MALYELKQKKAAKYSFPHEFEGIMNNPEYFDDPVAAFDKICHLYESSANKLRRLALSGMDLTDSITYPYVGIKVEKDLEGFLAGTYGTTISHPNILQEYYLDQFRIIADETKLPIWVGSSNYPMSLSFIDEDLFNEISVKRKISFSAFPCMKRIQSGLNGLHKTNGVKQLSMFHAERIGYSLNRLHHYCGTDAKHFQNTVIFANYDMYVDCFIEYGKEQIKAGAYKELVGPGAIYTKEHGWRRENRYFNPQMPAYHLVRDGRAGMTMINVNVGPSNVKTITDHVAVLQSDRWVMLGHCAGLRQENRVGDYVIAENYSRNDYVLDSYVPKHVPVTSSRGLVKLFLEEMNGRAQKVYTGTVVTTGDRNWELNGFMVDEFSEAKGIAIDMESATVATNAFRFGVESIAFLCISDVPLHGVLKLRSMAKEFYKTCVREHFLVCMNALSKVLHLRTSTKSELYHSYSKGEIPFR